MKTKVEHKYRLAIAGSIWEFDSVPLDQTNDGSFRISIKETERINKSVANAICGSPEKLTGEEFDFLCRITRTSYVEAADRLKKSPSTPSTWVKKGSVPELESEVFKQFIWEKIFGEDVTSSYNRPLRPSGAAALARMAAKAIEDFNVASPIRAA